MMMMMVVEVAGVVVVITMVDVGGGGGCGGDDENGGGDNDDNDHYLSFPFQTCVKGNALPHLGHSLHRSHIPKPGVNLSFSSSEPMKTTYWGSDLSI